MLCRRFRSLGLARSRRLALVVPLLVLATVATRLGAAPADPSAPMIEVQTRGETFRGKVLVHVGNDCFLLAQDLRIQQVLIDQVGRFRQVAPRFEAWSSSVLRDQLRREFPGHAVAGTRHYLAIAKTEASARQFAEQLESVYGAFQLYFSVRGLPLQDPPGPLVAIIFPDQPAFAQYAQRDKVQVNSQLRGYYSPLSNRVALFEEASPSRAGIQKPSLRLPDAPRAPHGRSPIFADLESGFFTTDSGTRGTLIHEATHQIAFNTGLHGRLVKQPRWIVEGLATVFEADGIRNSGAGRSIKQRLNPERYIWFGNYAKERRPKKGLEAFLASDRLFTTVPLDAYSEAWALTFFLVETRPREYARLLAASARRPPLSEETPKDRLADFRASIGTDLPLLEAEFLRFMSNIR